VRTGRVPAGSRAYTDMPDIRCKKGISLWALLCDVAKAVAIPKTVVAWDVT
jgi:hypothetical protein